MKQAKQNKLVRIFLSLFFVFSIGASGSFLASCSPSDSTFSSNQTEAVLTGIEVTTPQIPLNIT